MIWSGFVANSGALWQAYQLSKTMKARPSDVYGISGAFRRFCFDQAVVTFGLSLEAELDSIKAKDEKVVQTRRARTLAKWLDQPQKFRNPVAQASPTAGTTSSGEGGEADG